MKLCAIGNSHLGAIKLAWGQEIRASFPDTTIDFFGSPAQTLKRVRREGRRIIPNDDEIAENFRQTSGGNVMIEVDHYDHIFIIATGLSLHWIVDLYAAFRSDEHSRSDQYLLSPAAFREAAWGQLTQTAAIQLWKTLRSMGLFNVTLSPNPLPGQGGLCLPGGEYWLELVRNGDLPNILSLFDSYVAERRSEGAIVRPQPLFTISNDIFTKDCYSLGYPQIGDDVHKNTSYGAIVIQDLLKHV